MKIRNYSLAVFLLHLVPREDLLGKEILATQEKIDHGLRETVYGNNLPDIYQILENIVYGIIHMNIRDFLLAGV